jgi:proteic killer suppression protein
MLNRAKTLRDLLVPPGNLLEALHGDREGQYSIRINDQWRICFEWQEGDAYNVEILDYH